MRKLVVLSFMSLDGVVQAPGGQREDTSGGFRFGGWVYPFFDEFLAKEMVNQMSNGFDLLLGRKTYQVFSTYWPFADTENDPIAAAMNSAKKYVVSNTLEKAEWSNSFIVKGNIPEEIRKLKEKEGPDIQVQGSGNLIQTLLKNDLVDELWLKIFPVALGSGKKLFADGDFAGSFEIVESKTSPAGVFIVKYRRAGKIKVGAFVE
jgi:dihydrofolate reductase